MNKARKEKLKRWNKVRNKMNSLLKVLWRGKHPYPRYKGLELRIDNELIQKIYKHFGEIGYITLVKRTDGRFDWYVN